MRGIRLCIPGVSCTRYNLTVGWRCWVVCMLGVAKVCYCVGIVQITVYGIRNGGIFV